MLRHSAVVLVGAVALTSCGTSPTRTLIPAPRSVEARGGSEFVVTAETTIVVSPGDERVVKIGRHLADLIGLAAAPEPPRVVPAGAAVVPGSIHLRLGKLSQAGEEAYELVIAPEGVTITANQPAGLFYGAQTFRQLLPPFVDYGAVRPETARAVRAPAARITDYPRFAWRGAMLDVSRHFFSVDEVKRYMDLMSLYKLNRLHVHLADDQGWRIEITSWPNLARHGGSTEVGGGPGGYYTQQQYADLVAYAQDRFITIVPEIDMPGHTNAALASYAELNCNGVAPSLYTGIDVGFSALCVDKEITYKFIDDVVREIAELTPGAYFHVGGDEVKTLSPAQYVQFIERVQKIVRSHGKQMIGWDEIAPARLAPGSLVQHWRPDGSPAAAVAQGAKVIMSPANKAYLDMKYDSESVLGLSWAGYIDVEDAYAWDPAQSVRDVPESALAGIEAPIWSETLADIRDVEFMAFPRLAAIAELGWSRADGRAWGEFKGRLGAQAPRWTALGVNFFRSPAVPWKWN
ncbi:MAG: beta-N-acetylhexosaminidase [Vicinamibacterales bacterium]